MSATFKPDPVKKCAGLQFSVGRIHRLLGKGTSNTHASRRRLYPLPASVDSDMPPQPTDADLDTNKDGQINIVVRGMF